MYQFYYIYPVFLVSNAFFVVPIIFSFDHVLSTEAPFPFSCFFGFAILKLITCQGLLWPWQDAVLLGWSSRISLHKAASLQPWPGPVVYQFSMISWLVSHGRIVMTYQPSPMNILVYTWEFADTRLYMFIYRYNQIDILCSVLVLIHSLVNRGEPVSNPSAEAGFVVLRTFLLGSQQQYFGPRLWGRWETIPCLEVCHFDTV